jgi:hypothetical protein
LELLELLESFESEEVLLLDKQVTMNKRLILTEVIEYTDARKNATSRIQVSVIKIDQNLGLLIDFNDFFEIMRG